MGDHRATIKIEFEMHGVTTKQEMWINWWPGAWMELPKSVTDAFKEAEWKSLAAFYERQDEADAETKARTAALARSARAKLTADELAALGVVV